MITLSKPLTRVLAIASEGPIPVGSRGPTGPQARAILYGLATFDPGCRSIRITKAGAVALGCWFYDPTPIAEFLPDGSIRRNETETPTV